MRRIRIAPIGLMVTWLVILTAVVLLIFSVLQAERERGALTDVAVYISSGNIYRDVFTETFETAIILLEGGDYYAFTTQDAFSISIGATYIREFLKLHGHEISDLRSIIHNHFATPRFSESDIREYHKLVGYGFTGSFLMLHTPTGNMYKLVDGEGVMIGSIDEDGGEGVGGFFRDSWEDGDADR